MRENLDSMPNRKVILTVAAAVATVTVAAYAADKSAGINIEDHPVSAMEEAVASSSASSASSKAAALTFGPETIADLAEKAAPAVVNIEVDFEIDDSVGLPGLSGLPLFGFDKFDFFFNGKRMPKGFKEAIGQRRNTGSGFLVRPDGYIVTNAHVVKNATKIEVTLLGGARYTAKVVGLDHVSDLAVLKIEADNLPILKIGSSKNLRPGEFAIAVGSPLGYDHTVTLGIISAIGRNEEVGGTRMNFIQTDAAINNGNSGGPLLNLRGEVIGVNTAVRLNAQSIGFAIPADEAGEVTEALIAHKKIFRPWLGIKMKALTPTVLKSLGASPELKGMLITEVIAQSPAAASGLRNGDIIVKIDGKDMTSAREIQNYVRAHKVNDKLNFFVIRDARASAFELTIGEYPDTETIPEEKD